MDAPPADERRPRMSQPPKNDNSVVVPFAGHRFPDEFEVCWAGEFSVPSSPPLFCFGSVDGKLLFASEDLTRLVEGKGDGSVSREAINGVARVETWMAVSTRREVNFWSTAERQGRFLSQGAHGISATPSGYFIAPLGRTGILTVKAPIGDDTVPVAHTAGDASLYIYRVACLGPSGGKEVLVSAARLGGIVAGEFSGSQETHTMNTVAFKNFDAVDISPLCPGTESLALAALSRDGSLVLFQDVLTDRKPKTFKFNSVQGVAYRVLGCQGDVYVLTSRGMYVLAKLGSRFIAGEPMERITTPVLPLPMQPIDMNLAWGRWLLVVQPNEVRNFDVGLIHDLVPRSIGRGEVQELRPDILSLEPEWTDIKSTTRALAVAP
jgi:hypothetical protein